MRFLEYFTSTIAPEPFVERAVKRPLDGRQNRSSYVTADTSVGFGGEVVGLNLP
jgi:hypothetical protein